MHGVRLDRIYVYSAKLKRMKLCRSGALGRRARAEDAKRVCDFLGDLRHGFRVGVYANDGNAHTDAVHIGVLVEFVKAANVRFGQAVFRGAPAVLNARDALVRGGPKVDHSDGRPDAEGFLVHFAEEGAVAGVDPAVLGIDRNENVSLEIGRALHYQVRVRLFLQPTAVQPYADLKVKGAAIVVVHLFKIWFPFLDRLRINGKVVMGVKVF